MASDSLIPKIFRFYERNLGWAMATVGSLVGVIGYCDYLVGTDVSLLVLYLVPVCFATWVVGNRFGVITATLSLILWSFTNLLAAGRHAYSPFVSGWNIFSVFCVFIVIILLLSRFELFLRGLEARVEERTLALRRLQKEILEVSEQEQRRISHDLHDTVCQILAGTTIAMKILENKLSAQGRPEAEDLREIKSHVQHAIEIARDIARGLSPIAMSTEGLMDALHQLAKRITQQHSTPCTLDYNDPLIIPDVATATQLYLITQEAVTNAVRHSQATSITIRIHNDAESMGIEVTDNGLGMPATPRSQGMGRRIMSYRALLIGAEFSIRSATPQGTTVLCSLKQSALEKNQP